MVWLRGVTKVVNFFRLKVHSYKSCVDKGDIIVVQASPISFVKHVSRMLMVGVPQCIGQDEYGRHNFSVFSRIALTSVTTITSCVAEDVRFSADSALAFHGSGFINS